MMTSCTYDDVISLMKSWLWWSRVREGDMVARGAWNIACWTILGREQFIWVPSVVPITYSVGSHFGGLGCHHNSPLLLHQLFTYTVYPPTPAHSSIPPSTTILHIFHPHPPPPRPQVDQYPDRWSYTSSMSNSSSSNSSSFTSWVEYPHPPSL